MSRLALIVFCSVAVQSAFAFTNLHCESVGGDTRAVIFQNVDLAVQNPAQSELVMTTDLSKEVFSKVECGYESNPDKTLYCQHDRFGMVIALDEQPMEGVLNPYVIDGHEYGPFYFVCVISK